MHILHHREVKLKKDYVDVLCMLATFDNLLLISTFLLFSLPTLSENYTTNVRAISLFWHIINTCRCMYIQQYTGFEASPILVWFFSFTYLHVPIFLFWPCPIIWFGVSTTEVRTVWCYLYIFKVQSFQESQRREKFIINKVFHLPTYVYPKCNQTISVYLLLLFSGSFLQ